MSGSRPAWMNALFAEAYGADSAAEVDAVIDDWMDTMPTTEGVEDAFETVVEQGYITAEEDPDAYTLQAAARGDRLNCAGRAFATAALAWERHGAKLRPLIHYEGTAEEPEGSHLCLLVDRQGEAGGTVYGSNAPDTLESIENGPHRYEILDADGFCGMYLAAEAYMAWQNGDYERAQDYGDRIAALDLNAPYLDARIGEMHEECADSGIIVA